MKKVFFSLSVFLLSLTASYGQMFNQGDLDIHMGIGLKNNLYPGNTIEVGIPSITLSGDYGLNDSYGPGVIGVGAIVGFTSFAIEETIANAGTSGIDYDALFVAGKVSYHLELIENLDTYGAAAIYYANLSDAAFGNFTISNKLKPKLGLWLFIGSKYYITDKLGIFAELGFNSSVFTTGVCFKF